MTRVARYAYVLLSVAFAFGLVVQVTLAGMGLFVDVTPRGGPSFTTHQTLGWILHLAPLPIVLAAFFARAGRRHWVWALVLAVVVFIVPMLVVMRDSQPFVAALHPVLAALAFGLSLMVVRNSVLALREPMPASAPSRPG